MKIMQLIKASGLGFLWLGMLFSVRAQTYTWADNAQGQIYEICGGTTNYWPNNPYWTQSQQTNANCDNSGIVISQPSNWDPAPPVGAYPGGPGAVGVNAVLGAPANTFFQGSATLNSLTIQTDGALTLGPGTLAAQSYDFQGDGILATSGNNLLTLLPGGLMKKSGGINTFAIMPPVFITDATIEVDSGALVLSANLNNACSNGTFNVSNNAALDLTGGSSALWEGQMTGSGAGQVLLSGGDEIISSASPSGLTFNFPPNYFWWTGGQLGQGGQGFSIFTNAGAITVFSSGAPNLDQGILYNEGLVLETNAGTLGGNGSVENDASGSYEFAGDGSVGPSLSFINYGLVHKSSGTGSSVINVFYNESGTIEVDSGSLTLAGGETSTNGTFNIAAGALVDLTGGDRPLWAGILTGSGAGQVLLGSGILFVPPTGLALNFPPAQFWWTGGYLADNAATNLNAITIWATNSPSMSGCALYNQGIVQQTNSGVFAISAFVNQPSATYEFDGDGGSTSQGNFYNYGLLRKRTGTGTSVMGSALNNYGGTIEADSGTLVLANGNSSSSNGTFNVAAGALVDLTGGDEIVWAGTLTGGGAGEVLMGGGEISFPPTGLALNFPPGQFWWTGGAINNGSASAMTNLNAITIWATNSPSFVAALYNQGTVQQTNAGNFSVYVFVNQPSGTYEFDGDGGITGPYFSNFGLLRKRTGTGTSVVSSTLNNYGGTIEVDSGTLSVPGGFSSGAGTLTIALGGNGTGQCGQLLVNGSATLNGTLKVILTNNFAPATNSQFQIVACTSLGGTFTDLDLPSGCSVTYSNTGAYLVVTPPSVTIQPPQLTNGKFSFGFNTQSNQSYTVQQNANLATTNWIFYTNFLGNGSLMGVLAPVTNNPQEFFRVSEP
jgi:carbon monoxide dehydrogenase subunit G